MGRLTALLLALGAVLGLTASITTPAYADTTVRLCVISNGTVNINPGVHLSDGDSVNVALNGSGNLTGCGSGLTGTFTFTGTATMGCTGGSAVDLTWTVNWSNGKTSTVTTSGVQVALNGTYFGKTTSGDLAGTNVVSVQIANFDFARCSYRAGLTQVNLSGNLEFVQVA